MLISWSRSRFAGLLLVSKSEIWTRTKKTARKRHKIRQKTQRNYTDPPPLFLYVLTLFIMFLHYTKYLSTTQERNYLVMPAGFCYNSRLVVTRLGRSPSSRFCLLTKQRSAFQVSHEMCAGTFLPDSFAASLLMCRERDLNSHSVATNGF